MTFASASKTSGSEPAVKRWRGRVVPGVIGSSGLPAAGPGDGLRRRADYSFVDLGDSARISFMLTPKVRGTFREQACEVLTAMGSVLQRQPHPMTVTTQTVFLRDARDRVECDQLFSAHYGPDLPVTAYVLQAPCSGAALALEAWTIGGPSVCVQRFGPHALAVSYHSVRWVYCGGIEAASTGESVYGSALEGLQFLRDTLDRAGSGFEHVVRTWLYLGNITGPEAATQRYMELNRARTDFYRDIRFDCSLLDPSIPHGLYPASTGIGTAGAGLLMGCMTLQTDRKDALLLSLENPQQTPAYAYPQSYSPQSPKFSRAMATVLGDYLTVWISGTASIVNSETRHLDDIEKQTEQTIDNIERLIAPDNFAFHGVKGAGARLNDLAKVRVYLKRPEDFEACKVVCERRLGNVPAIYAVADICRPELLVEIEGVAFSRCATQGPG